MTIGHVRSPRPLRAPLARLALLISLLGLAAAVAPPAARADAVDNAFVTAVKGKGIDFASAQAAIVAGHEVCDELDLGKPKSDVASEMMNNSNLDGYRAGSSSAQAFPRTARGITVRPDGGAGLGSGQGVDGAGQSRRQLGRDGDVSVVGQTGLARADRVAQECFHGRTGLRIGVFGAHDLICRPHDG